MRDFLFHILPGRCEFTPSNRGKNFRRRALFFWRGLHRKWKLFWNTQNEYYRMKALNVVFLFVCCNLGIFLDFKKIYFLKKSNFWNVQVHLVNNYRSNNFLGYFLIQNYFHFLCSSYQKSVRSLKFSPTKSVQIGQSDRPKPLWEAGDEKCDWLRECMTTVFVEQPLLRPGLLIIQLWAMYYCRLHCTAACEIYTEHCEILDCEMKTMFGTDHWGVKAGITQGLKLNLVLAWVIIFTVNC